jgi:hypothetical protein
MIKSRIFTQAELKSLKNRMRGNKADPTGIFHARVKPKIKELLYWISHIKIIMRLL